MGRPLVKAPFGPPQPPNAGGSGALEAWAAEYEADHLPSLVLPPALGGWGGRPSPDLLAHVWIIRVEDRQVEVDQFGVFQPRAGAEGDHPLAPGEEAVLHQLARGDECGGGLGRGVESF